MRIRDALEFEHRIEQWPTLHSRMILDYIIQHERARGFVKEKDFFDERVAFESKLVKVIRPVVIRHVAQPAGEWQAPLLQRK